MTQTLYDDSGPMTLCKCGIDNEGNDDAIKSCQDECEFGKEKNRWGYCRFYRKTINGEAIHHCEVKGFKEGDS